MGNRNFRQMLEKQWSQGKFVCAGLDSDISKIPSSYVFKMIPEELRACLDIQLVFNHAIIEATHDLVCAYKPNIAFYEARGESGILALQRTISCIRRIAPEVPVILDAKRADIGNTNQGYVRMAFDYLQADAITINPYFGGLALQPFLDYVDKGIIVLCRTSNPGSGELQDLHVATDMSPLDYVPLYQYVALRVAKYWNDNGNCALVVGATYPEELAEVRRLVGDMPILIPGIGAQGGDVEKVVIAGKDSRGYGMIINSSSGIIFASKKEDFAEAARRETLKLHDLINQYR